MMRLGSICDIKKKNVILKKNKIRTHDTWERG